MCEISFTFFVIYHSFGSFMISVINITAFGSPIFEFGDSFFRTINPDIQYVAFGLAVRKLRTANPSGRTKLDTVAYYDREISPKSSSTASVLAQISAARLFRRWKRS